MEWTYWLLVIGLSIVSFYSAYYIYCVICSAISGWCAMSEGKSFKNHIITFLVAILIYLVANGAIALSLIYPITNNTKDDLLKKIEDSNEKLRTEISGLRRELDEK